MARVALCGCGEPIHYTDGDVEQAVEKLVEKLGPTIPVAVPEGTWEVPRHYIALHGLAAAELPELAARYGWRETAGLGVVPRRMNRG